MHMAAICFGLLGGLMLPLALTGTTGSATGADKARTCFGKHPTILGTQHGDRIKGTNGRDVIISLGGTDYIKARRGNDFVCAGPGDDDIHGAEGFNHLNGGPGDDWIDGRRGPGNVVIGSKGDDLVQAEGKIDGGSGNDTVMSYGYHSPSASPVPDVTDGGPGKDQIYGCGVAGAPQRPPPPPHTRGVWPDCWIGAPTAGWRGNAELLKGGSDDDKVFGGGGNDQLQGNDGTDRLYGEDGNDDIDGGTGTDACDQGPGTGSLTGCP